MPPEQVLNEVNLRTVGALVEQIRAVVDLETDASPDRVRALHQSVVATSPVGHTLSRAVPVSIDLRQDSRPA
jgi:hypothetical protein